MLAIILNIVKIIGIILLVMLGVLLLLFLVVLFVPVRYRAEGNYLDKKIHIGGRVTWLLHLVSLWASFEAEQPGPVHIRLKFLGIPVFDSLKRAKKKNRKETGGAEPAGEIGEIKAASIEQEAAPTGMQDKNVPSEEIPENGSADETDGSFSEKSNIFQKIAAFFDKFVNFFRKFKFTFQSICDTIRKIKDNIKYYLHVLQLESTKRAFETCKKQIGKIVKHIVPKKFRVNLHLGFEDPSVMGEVLAVWGMFYPIHQGNIDIQPEFGSAVMEGSFYVKGRISLFVFARIACILFFDRDIKRLVKQFRNRL